MSFNLSYVGAYSSTATYSQGDTVSEGDRLFFSLANSVSGIDPEGNPGTWQPFSTSLPRGPIATPEQHGAKGDAQIFADGAISAGSTTSLATRF